MREVSEADENSANRMNQELSFSENTNRNLAGEDTTDMTRKYYRDVIMDWIKKAIGYLFFFIFLQLALLFPIPISISLIPLFCSDIYALQTIYTSSKAKKFWKFCMLKEVIHQTCSIIFKILLIIYLSFEYFSIFFLLAPILITSIYDLIYKVTKDRECKYMTWLVSIM